MADTETTTVTVDVLPVKVIQSRPTAIDRVALVTDPDGRLVRVRWRLGRPCPWRCDVHGAQQAVACSHTFSVGLALADDLLGLTRGPELNPDEGETRE